MSFTVWFTGLSGAGKTTLSARLVSFLLEAGYRVVRRIISPDLGFSESDRRLNIRRLGFLSSMLNTHDVVSIVSAIAPYQEERLRNRMLIQRYIEVYCRASLESLEARDPKGLYRKARDGQVKNFTGISDIYEVPVDAEIVVDTDVESVEDSVSKVCDGCRELFDKFEVLNGQRTCTASIDWMSRIGELGYFE
jgi:adenylylsulfate kinase